MARIHDPRPLAGQTAPGPLDELGVRWGAGQPEARPAAPARSHALPRLRSRPQLAWPPPSASASASGDREPEPESPSQEPTGPDPNAPGEGVVRDEPPAEPNEPG